MAKKKPNESPEATKPLTKRRTREARENQLISLAYDEVERRLREGTATSQETTHFLKLGSSRAMLEKEILEKQKELMEAKAEAIRASKRIEELYADAIKAVGTYRSSVTIPANMEIYDE